MSRSTSRSPWIDLQEWAARWDTGQTIKHPDPANKCRFIPLSCAGVEFQPGPFASQPTPIRVMENSLIVYMVQTRSGPQAEDYSRAEFFGRVMALAISDGVGEKLDPPHLAVMTLSTDMRFVYFRLVHPQDVYSVVSSKVTLKWFIDTRDFTLSNLPLLLLTERHGSLNNRALRECLDVDGHLMPPAEMPYYISLFVRTEYPSGSNSVRIEPCLWDFELWLHNQGFIWSERGQPAADLLQVYRATVIVSASDWVRLQLHAQRIGFVSKD